MIAGLLDHLLERRLSRRRTSAETHGIRRVRVRPGQDVTVIDLSSGGVLVEGTYRLLPGARVEIHIRRQSSNAEIVRGRVLRCSVVHLCATAITYRGAIAFDRPLSLVPEDGSDGYLLPTSNVSHVPIGAGSRFP